MTTTLTAEQPSIAAERPADTTDPSATRRARVVVGVGSLACLAVGLLALALGWGAGRTVALWAFCFVGLGSAPWQLDRRLRLPTRLLLGATTSLIVLVLVSGVMEATDSWHPWIAFAIVAVVAGALHVHGLTRALREGRKRPARRAPGTGRVSRAGRPRRRTSYAQLLVAGGGTVLCLVAALTHRHLEPAFGGFPTQIGPVWWVGLAVLVLAVTLLGRDERQLGLSVLLLVLVLTLTPALVYDGPRSQSAAKHVDLVQQIRTYGMAVSQLGIYNSWAGFFSAMAWLCDVAGIRDPLVLARFWPALLAPVRVLALRFLFTRLLPGGRVVWVAVVVAVLADPLGADYFSPQSLGFVLGLLVFGLALSRGRTVPRLTLMLAAGCALAISHQLSPYVVGGVLVGLVVVRQTRPWWSPVLVLGPAVAWALINLGDVSSFIDLSSIGNVANFRPPKTDSSPGLARLPIVGWTIRALAGGLLVVGLLAAWTWLRALVTGWRTPARRAVLLRLVAYAGAPAVGLILVAVNPYGQEGIFRAVLFAVPWLAALAAWPLRRSGSWVARLPFVAVGVVLTLTFLVASFGLDRVNVIRSGDLGVVSYLAGRAASGADRSQVVLVLLSGDLPTTAGREGVQEAYVSFSDIDPTSGLTSSTPADQEQQLTTNLRAFADTNDLGRPYVLWSPTTAAYSWAYGLQTPTESVQLRDAFQADPRWERVYDQQGTVLFHYRG